MFKWTGIFALIILSASALRADTVVMKSGKTMEGEIVNQTADAVVIRTPNGTVEIRRSDISEIKKGAAAKEVASTVNRDELKKKAGGGAFTNLDEKPEKCPKCTGTGIAIWLECLNCNKSAKPGYKNFGDYWEACKRCQGTAKIAAARCNTCTGKGTVLLSQLKPADGGRKEPPKGFKWCDGCDGTGAAIWNDCSQCKRSKFPGYTFHGDSVELCGRCKGATKFPALGCSRCTQKGLLPLSDK